MAGLRHIPGGGRAGCLSCSARCVYCGLAVRLAGECGHPGYGVVEQLGATAGPLADLRLLHRFCRDALGRGRRGALRRGVCARRARLGRATELHEAGLPPRRHDRLGVERVRGGDPRSQWKHWRMAKMRYACKACRYYAPSHP